MESSAKRNRFGRSDSFAESSLLGLHPERDAEVDHLAVQAEADIFRRFASEVKTEKQNTHKNLSQPITTWSYDMEGHDENVSKGIANLLGKHIGTADRHTLRG